MRRMCIGLLAAIVSMPSVSSALPVVPQGSAAAADDADDAAEKIIVGFGETDITPDVKEKPVYMAGFGQNRKATGVRDPLKARAVVFKHGDKKVAMVSIDVVGFFYPNTLNVRNQLPDFTYVLVSSTHNHEGPDTLGLWGPNPFTSGVDPAYLKSVEDKTAAAVKAADAAAKPRTARLGKAHAPELLHDGREPYVLHDELVALEFRDDGGKPTGILVQWNCHPETLGSKNTEVSADYIGHTVKHLAAKFKCPVVYFTGTVGGLMTSLHVKITDDAGKQLPEESSEKTERFGFLLGKVGEKAVSQAKPVRLTPIEARSRAVFVPMTNRNYLIGRQLGVLPRDGYLWTGDIYQAEALDAKEFKKPMCMKTEVARIKLGDLEIAAIPGEIYPELVLNKVQDPPDAGADFPDAPIEPAIYSQLQSRHKMIIGLANDEIGYIIPKRQWDEKAPFCYGRKKSQYGEVNSVGPDAAPILCKAFKELVNSR